MFSDKVEAIAQSDALRDALGFDSEIALRTEFAEIIALQNELAHGHDIVGNGVASLSRTATRTEELLMLCESVA